jgi:hypothetical protein
LEKDLAWNALSRHYPKVTASLMTPGDKTVVRGDLTPLPGALGMNNSTSANDLAAYRISGNAKVDILRLAAIPPVVGDIVFLNSRYVGWTPAKVTQVDHDNLVYRFYLPNTQLSGTSGAPVVNQQGEVVALNVAGKEGEVSIGVGNPCDSMKKLLEKVKK